MWILGLSVLVGVILISFAATATWRTDDEEDPRTILDRRYARGEIDRPTYEQMFKDLARHA